MPRRKAEVRNRKSPHAKAAPRQTRGTHPTRRRCFGRRHTAVSTSVPHTRAPAAPARRAWRPGGGRGRPTTGGAYSRRALERAGRGGFRTTQTGAAPSEEPQWAQRGYYGSAMIEICPLNFFERKSKVTEILFIFYSCFQNQKYIL